MPTTLVDVPDKAKTKAYTVSYHTNNGASIICDVTFYMVT